MIRHALGMIAPLAVAAACSSSPATSAAASPCAGESISFHWQPGSGMAPDGGHCVGVGPLPSSLDVSADGLSAVEQFSGGEPAASCTPAPVRGQGDCPFDCAGLTVDAPAPGFESRSNASASAAGCTVFGPVTAAHVVDGG